MEGEENKEGKGGAQDHDGGAGDDLATLKAKIEQLESQNKELFNETKLRSKKLKELEDEKAALEESKKKEAGEYKSLFESEREKNLKIAQEFKEGLLDTQLERAAVEAGCTNLGVLKKLTSDYGEKVKFDEKFRADPASMTAYISHLKDTYKDLNLFKAPVKGVQDAGTGGSPDEGDYLKEMKACKTQAELNAVMKKHGKLK